jgi:hypothetical protein
LGQLIPEIINLGNGRQRLSDSQGLTVGFLDCLDVARVRQVLGQEVEGQEVVTST